MRRIAVLSAGVFVVGLLGQGSALAAEDESTGQDDRWIAVEDHFAVVLPNGETFTEDNPPPMEQEDVLPPVGTRLFISEALYDTDDGSTRGSEIGRTHIECTIQVAEANTLCDIAFVFNDGSQLHGTVHIDFGAQSETEPLQLDIAVTGGTGAYSGASGEVSLLDISDPNDPNAEIVSLYEADLD